MSEYQELAMLCASADCDKVADSMGALKTVYNNIALESYVL